MSIPITAGGTIEAADFTGTRIISIPLCDAAVISGAVEISNGQIYSSSDTVLVELEKGLGRLPDGAVIDRVDARVYCDDAAATVTIEVYRNDDDGSATLIAACGAADASGWQTVSDTTVAESVIFSDGTSYFIRVVLDPNNAKLDARALWVQLTLTITHPKP